MTADRRHEQNLFCLLEAPQMLYIGLILKVKGLSTYEMYLEESTNQCNNGIV